MVLLHGLGGSRISWEPQLAGLCDRFRVVAWDLPGYGDSPALPGAVTFAGLADAVAVLLDELGEQQVHAVGISFGGMIAQHFVHRHGDRVLTLSLLATTSRFGLDGTDPVEWRARRLAALDAGRSPADLAPDVLGSLAGPDIEPEAFEQQCAAMARIPADALRRSIDCLVTHDTQGIAATIAVPTQVLVGEYDEETPVASAKDLAERIPGAVVHVITGAGHLLNAEAPTAVNELLARHALAHDRKERP
jgi:3-oxoadipate enol-lactonase